MRLIAFLAACLSAVTVQAAELGDDGLHKASWMRETFKDLRRTSTRPMRRASACW